MAARYRRRGARCGRGMVGLGGKPDVVVELGKVVTWTRAVRDAAGERVASVPRETPESVLYGITPVHPELEAAVRGAGPGERRVVELSAADPTLYDPAQLRVIPRSGWPAGSPPSPGAVLTFTERWPDGATTRFTGEVRAVDDAHVLLDGNGPAARHRYTVEIDVLAVRDATPAEVEARRPLRFPFDVLAARDFTGPVGERILRYRDASMTPPYPWGQHLYARLLAERCADLEGDVIELGVGLGGMSLFLAELAREAGRRVYALDTFEGLPEPDPVRDNPYFRAGMYAGRTPLLDRFVDLVAEHGLADVVVPMPGLFADTLPTLPPDVRFCFAHLDSDLYGSVHDSLVGVWDRLVDGGVLVVDDFFHHAQGPRRACNDFFAERGIRPTYHVSFPYSVFVIKGEPEPDRAWRGVDGDTCSLGWLRRDEALLAEIEASVARAVPGTRAHDNAARLLALLRAETPRTSDIYAYWWALEDFWDAFGAGASGDVRL